MITVTVNELVASANDLNMLTNIRMPAKAAYRLNKAILAVQKALDPYEKTRLGLVEQYGAKNDAGVLSVIPENMEKFMEALMPVLEETVELDVLKIQFSLIEKIDISPRELMNLGWLFEEDGPIEIKK